MPKLLCPCGYIHDLSPIPDEGYVTFKDSVSEEILYPGKEQVEDENRHGLIGRESGLLYECPVCGRIMWRKPTDDAYRIYRPDDQATR